MNKKQLIAKISATLNLSKADAERTFDSITNIILDALKSEAMPAARAVALALEEVPKLSTVVVREVTLSFVISKLAFKRASVPAAVSTEIPAIPAARSAVLDSRDITFELRFATPDTAAVSRLPWDPEAPVMVRVSPPVSEIVKEPSLRELGPI